MASKEMQEVQAIVWKMVPEVLTTWDVGGSALQGKERELYHAFVDAWMRVRDLDRED
jgi:hypothetical protein